MFYDDLAASDATGRALQAWFTLRGGRATVDDRGATYPVRVDPVVQQTSVLISSNGTFGGGFDAYEALSKLGEQIGLIATVELALGLSTLGLGEDPYARSVPLDAPPNFTGHILDGLGDVPAPGLPNSVGPSGIIWSDALALSAEQTHMGSIFATRPPPARPIEHHQPREPARDPGPVVLFLHRDRRFPGLRLARQLL